MAFSSDNPASVRQHKIHFYRQIAFTFIGAALVVLIGLVYFSLSQALIVVKPSLEPVSSEFNVLVKSGTTLTEEGIAATLVSTEVEIEKSSQSELLAEGEAQPATGKVTLKNTSNNPQPLVATTRLLSESGVLFRLTKAATVPANGEIDADVYADQPGKGGEIAPSRFTIPGLNQTRQQEVYAQSTAAMTGGTKATYRVTKKAIDEAVELAKERVITQAKTQLQAAGTNPESFMAGGQWVNITSQAVEPEEGADAQTFTVTIKATVAFVVGNETDLLEIAQKELYGTTSLGYELSSSDEGSFKYTIENFDASQKSAQIRVTLSGVRRISTNNPLLDPSNFVGQKPDAVKEQLEADPGIESVEIKLRPFWLRRIPRLVDHIYVQFAS